MIITLCGSTRFEPWFHIWNEMLSLSGHQVFGLASYPSQHGGVKEWYTPEEKQILDDVHKAKIDLSDAILVLNVFAYIGESTMAEIVHAREEGCKVYALESWKQGLGVGPNHKDDVIEAKRRYVPADYVSPMDTFYPHMIDPWVTALLGQGGARRTRIVERYYRFKSELLSYPLPEYMQRGGGQGSSS